MNTSLLTPLTTQFEHRDALIDYVRELNQLPQQKVGERFIGGREAAVTKLNNINPLAYARTRNHATGAVTQLSPYVRHGVITSVKIQQHLKQHFPPEQHEKLLQQLSWRSFFHYIHQQAPEKAWFSREAYKTGFVESDYAAKLPDDIALGQTGVRLIDQLIEQLLTHGYLHNHYRLYLSSYIVHWRRVQWQAGASFMLAHLLDGDIASNNYSWQWVASTFSSKPYIFNLDNVKQFADSQLDTAHESNACFDNSYEALHAALFPHLDET